MSRDSQAIDCDSVLSKVVDTQKAAPGTPARPRGGGGGGAPRMGGGHGEA